jgi:hypothetical protein
MSGISFPQAAEGLDLSWRRFQVTRAAFELVANVLNGSESPGFVYLPTGEVDDEGQPMRYELDLKQTLPEGRGVTEGDRLDAIRQQLLPWHNYLAKEYEVWLAKHVKFGEAILQMLEAAREVNTTPTPETAPANSPGTIRVNEVPPPPR